MTEVTITSHRSDGAHIGIYEDLDQQGGSFVDVVGGIIRLMLVDPETGAVRNYDINLDTFDVSHV